MIQFDYCNIYHMGWNLKPLSGWFIIAKVGISSGCLLWILVLDRIECPVAGSLQNVTRWRFASLFGRVSEWNRWGVRKKWRKGDDWLLCGSLMKTRASLSFAWKFNVTNSYLCHKIKQLGSKLSLFSNGRDGHEPYSRHSYTHYKHIYPLQAFSSWNVGWVHPQYKELRNTPGHINM